MTDILGREGVEYYTLIIQGKKVDIVANLEGKKVGDDWQDGYRISEVYIDNELRVIENEILMIIKEALQSRWGKDKIFVDIESVVYRGGKIK